MPVLHTAFLKNIASSYKVSLQNYLFIWRPNFFPLHPACCSHFHTQSTPLLFQPPLLVWSIQHWDDILVIVLAIYVHLAICISRYHSLTTFLKHFFSMLLLKTCIMTILCLTNLLRNCIMQIFLCFCLSLLIQNLHNNIILNSAPCPHFWNLHHEESALCTFYYWYS